MRSTAAAQEDVAADHRRHRVARQADQRHAVGAGPAISGFPGRIATRWKSSVEPVRERRPLHQVEVADRGAAERDDQVGALASGQRPRRGSRRVSRAIGSSRASAPAASSIAFSPKPFEATIWSGPGSSPGITSSSPVGISATTGRRATATRGASIAASSARSTGRSRRGAATRAPAGSRRRPGGCSRRRSRPRGRRSRRRRASASSWITTRSAPSGTGAPVKIRTASPGPTAPAKRAPAVETPTTRSRAPGTPRLRRGPRSRPSPRRRTAAGRAKPTTSRRQHAPGGLGQRHLLGAERRERARSSRACASATLDQRPRHGASKRPDLPPSLSASRISPITMPRSTAFSMS